MEAELKIVLLVAQIYQEVLLLLAQILMKVSKTFRYRDQIVDIISAARMYLTMVGTDCFEMTLYSFYFLSQPLT